MKTAGLSWYMYSAATLHNPFIKVITIGKSHWTVLQRLHDLLKKLAASDLSCKLQCVLISLDQSLEGICGSFCLHNNTNI